MAHSGYHIADEPRPSRLAQLAVHPMWPLFGHMFGGALLAWPWFAVNGMVVGSPTRWRELIVAGGGFLFSALAGFGVLSLADQQRIPAGALPYCVIALTVFKIGISYYLFILQDRSFELYVYFGGAVKNGLPFVIIGAIVVRQLLAGHAQLEFLLR